MCKYLECALVCHHRRLRPYHLQPKTTMPANICAFSNIYEYVYGCLKLNVEQIITLKCAIKLCIDEFLV